MAAQFERACRLLGVEFTKAPVVVACSGGADSAAALLLARAVAPHARFIACYVDHSLRPRLSIERDIAAVREQAKIADATVVIKSIPRRAHRCAQSPEEAAREARYRELEVAAREAGANLVITGHQRDDLAETSLLALVRGSGIDGVAAMRPKRPLSGTVSLVRPLLWAAKAQCVELVGAYGATFSEDETNADTRIPRNAVRALLAELERGLPQSSRGIARSAALIADDRALLDGLTARALDEARLPNSPELSTAALRKLPIALLRRVIRSALRARGISLRNFSFEHCDAIAQAVKNQRGGRYHAASATVLISGGKFVIEKERDEATAFEAIRIDLERIPASYSTPFGIASLSKSSGRARKRASDTTQRLDFDSIQAAGDLELRTPRIGDTCTPSGRHRSVSLARFLSKAGVPVTRRSRIALLCAGGRIAAALGIRVMAPFEARPHGSMLEVRWQPADI